MWLSSWAVYNWTRCWAALLVSNPVDPTECGRLYHKLFEVLLTTEVGSNSKGDHNGQFSSNKEDIVRVRKEVDRCSHPR